MMQTETVRFWSFFIHFYKNDGIFSPFFPDVMKVCVVKWKSGHADGGP
jgi:hypothetical protein